MYSGKERLVEIIDFTPCQNDPKSIKTMGYSPCLIQFEIYIGEERLVKIIDFTPPQTSKTLIFEVV
jgi:hypothetical protein